MTQNENNSFQEQQHAHDPVDDDDEEDFVGKPATHISLDNFYKNQSKQNRMDTSSSIARLNFYNKFRSKFSKLLDPHSNYYTKSVFNSQKNHFSPIV